MKTRSTKGQSQQLRIESIEKAIRADLTRASATPAFQTLSRVMQAARFAGGSVPFAGRTRREFCASHRRALRSFATSPRADIAGLTLRRGNEGDANTIRLAILREKMNPLGLDPRRFVVAEEDGRVVGFGQLKPWETLSNRPKGDFVGNVVRMLNLQPNWRGQLLELASLVVMPEHRGRGVGTALLNRLIEDSINAKDPETLLKQETTVCLLTLKSTVGFYERAGFSVENTESPHRNVSACSATGQSGTVPRSIRPHASSAARSSSRS